MSELRRNALKSRAPRKPGSRKYEAWRQNIANGMREAKLKRRQAGLMTPSEVAVELGLSKRSVADLFTVIVAGMRKYIRRKEVERWKAGASEKGDSHGHAEA